MLYPTELRAQSLFFVFEDPLEDGLLLADSKMWSSSNFSRPSDSSTLRKSASDA